MIQQKKLNMRVIFKNCISQMHLAAITVMVVTVAVSIQNTTIVDRINF